MSEHFNNPKPTLLYRTVLCVISAIALLSCGQSREQSQAEEQEYRQILHRANALYNEGKREASVRLMDSLLGRKDNLPPYAQFIRFAHKEHYYAEAGKSDTARVYADSALGILENNKLEKRYPSEYTTALLDAGNIQTALSQYDKAIEYYTRAKVFSSGHPDSCDISAYNYRIAMTLYKQGKYKAAIDHFNYSFAEARACSRNTPYFRMQEMLDNIGMSYDAEKRTDSARFYYDSTLSFIKRNEVHFESAKMGKSARAVVYKNLGTHYVDIGKPDSAIVLYKLALEADTNSGNGEGIRQAVLYSMSVIYLTQRKFPETYATLQDLKKSVDRAPGDDVEYMWRSMMVNYYGEKQDYEKGFGAFSELLYFKIALDAKRQQLKESNIARDVKDKEQEYQIQLLKKDNELSKLYLWVTVGCFIVVLLIAFLIYFSFRKSRRQNREIMRQKTELEKLNREKDKILSVVAHDLRNPVGAISYLADYLIDSSEDETPNESLALIKASSQHSLALINELLGFRDMDKHKKKERILLKALLDETSRMLQFRLKEKDQQLRTEYPGEDAFVDGNRERLLRLINNLVINAIKFSHRGAEIVLGLRREGDRWMIYVKDQGIGIPADIQPALFDMFTESRRKGTQEEQSFGLGLSISRQIAEEHGGHIRFESEEDKGTTFYVELPAQTA